ncbi:hypothetical protein DS2_06421 [Catenovulum agarivorans DS-2]|uniref:Uncharacterized protein n=1 Tax=Catenovulum agarivorans DS-2 TaxID=1328313 RepID=W7QDC3_9ALTE|nr:hypothetical protein DS2_06421 [Catenovulum agarivorans DS-2]
MHITEFRMNKFRIGLRYIFFIGVLICLFYVGYFTSITHTYVSTVFGSDLWMLLANHTIGLDNYYSYTSAVEKTFGFNTYFIFLNLKNSVFSGIFLGLCSGFLIKNEWFLRLFVLSLVCPIIGMYVYLEPTQDVNLLPVFELAELRFKEISRQIAHLVVLLPFVLMGHKLRQIYMLNKTKQKDE